MSNCISCISCMWLRIRISNYKCFCTKSEHFNKKIPTDIIDDFGCSNHKFEQLGGQCNESCDPERFTIEKHGAGYALYKGRCNHQHGLNLAYITEATDADLEIIEDTLNLKTNIEKLMERINHS